MEARISYSASFFRHIGIKVCLCETTSPEQIEAEIHQGCQLLYVETPTNPTLKVIDIARLARAARAAGAIMVTDNTLATPINQRPLELGTDLVVHSASKFLGGHADALGGIVCGKKAFIQRIFHYREITGAALDPFAAYLLLRGLKTLEIRIERQNASALKIRAVPGRTRRRGRGLLPRPRIPPATRGRAERRCPAGSGAC